ncbi:MAG: pilus assembly protein PilM [Pirellulaceae bacterium]
MIFSRTQGWIGVDIGTHSVKLAQVERRGSRVQLVEALSIPRQQPWPENDDAMADISSSQEIQAAISLGTRFRGRAAAVTLPMAVCDVRTCHVVGDTDSERRSAVSRELELAHAEAAGPHTPTTREFDHWSVETPADQGLATDNTIALSVPSSWASRVARDMREAGLIGHVLDGLPLAMARAIALSMPSASQPIAAIDWGHHRATLCLVVDGRPLFVRGLRGGGFQSVTTALCKSLDVTADEAQKLLYVHGLPNRTRGAVTDVQSVVEEVAREPLDRLVEELGRTTSYLSQQRRRIAPAKIVLMGGGAAVKNMAGYLDDRTELPVETWHFDGAASTALHDRWLSIEMFGPAIALSSLAWTV